MTPAAVQTLSQDTATACDLKPFGEEAQIIHAALVQALGDDRRQHAEQLLATIFALRPSDTEAGQAWVLSIASTCLARAILASVGPRGDAEPLLAITLEQVRKQVAQVQSQAIRSTIAGRN